MRTGLQINIIAESFICGKGSTIGNFCVIEDDVITGYLTIIENYVLLKRGTRIGNHCYLDSYVKSSGDNYIGDNVTIRYNATIAKGVSIAEDVFIAPNVMTIYSNPNGARGSGISIGKNAFIGTGSVINTGVKIGENVIIGANSYVNKDCISGTYVGNPAMKISDKCRQEK